jgi:hypothetical protein
MAIGFISLCDQILAASSPYTPYDASKKPLSTLLNEMTYYVATASKVENEDESIISGYRYSREKISFELFCLSFRLQLLLLNDVERVRAASLRALRYSIHRLTILDKFLESRLDYLVCRSVNLFN